MGANSDNELDDENDVIETSPNGRWQKLRRKVAQKDSSGIEEAHLAYDTEEGIEVVWNQITFSATKTQQNIENIKTKFANLIELKHNNVVKFYDFWVDQQRLVFITESMTSGTLKLYLRKNKKANIVISPKVWKRWCRQILSALMYLHDFVPPIIHGNLRCDSIFLQHNGLIKVGAVCLDDIRHHVRTVGIDTTQYMAPEQQNNTYSEKVDIYAFGMCALEMATGETPYAECTSVSELFKKVVAGEKPQALQRTNDPMLYDFVCQCLAPEQQRPAAAELLFHQFFNEVPALKVMSAHSILRHGLDADPLAKIPSEIQEFLDEVRVGAWGTLANVKLTERRSMSGSPKCEVASESDGVLQIVTTVLLPGGLQATSDVVLSREMTFNYRTDKDTPERAAQDMAVEGLVCVADIALVVDALTDALARHKMKHVTTATVAA
eukprot:Opistho-2@24157